MEISENRNIKVILPYFCAPITWSHTWIDVHVLDHCALGETHQISAVSPVLITCIPIYLPCLVKFMDHLRRGDTCGYSHAGIYKLWRTNWKFMERQNVNVDFSIDIEMVFQLKQIYVCIYMYIWIWIWQLINDIWKYEPMASSLYL